MTSKAQQFALIAEGLGWAVERIKGKKDPTARRVIATRGNERYTLTWDRNGPTGRERFRGGSHAVTAERDNSTHVELVKLVKDAIEGMSGLAPKTTPHTHSDGTVTRLPFDPIESTDVEVLKAVAGKRITWRNSISGLDETGVCPRGGMHLRMQEAPNGDRYISFMSADGKYRGYRDARLTSIRKVSK